MTRMQLESGSASSAAHRAPQPSTTLNRRYVSRPTNLAIEEAVANSSRSSREVNSQSDSPSRLVNLRVHSADLIAAQNEPQDTSPIFTPQPPLIHSVVEFGGTTDTNQATSYDYSTPATPIAPEATTTYPEYNNYYNNYPTEAMPTEMMITAPADDVNQYVPITDVVPEEISTPVDPYANLSPALVTTSIEFSQDVSPIPGPFTFGTPGDDLAMNIAADYATASFNANLATNDLNSAASVDAIARAASEAIASIRTATEPEAVAEQIASLQAFAANIKADASIPEMVELGDTIEKFINVATKSTKSKKSDSSSISLNSKATRAADKVAKSSAKIINTKPSVTTSRTTTRATAPKVTPVRSSIRRAPTTARPASRPVTPTTRRASTATTARRRASIDQDQALRHALRSVASMDEEESTTTRAYRHPTHKKSGLKRFALAFVCTIACVGVVTYLVGTNIPDVSVRVAAMQTGVEASYPSYIPRDYSLKDINSENGKITLTFAGPDNASFSLIEEKSSWDSSTLLRAYVEPTWQDNYSTTHEQGITIYISGSNAAWVNGGVLYKITTTSGSLTTKQLRNIVTSM